MYNALCKSRRYWIFSSTDNALYLCKTSRCWWTTHCHMQQDRAVASSCYCIYFSFYNEFCSQATMRCTLALVVTVSFFAFTTCLCLWETPRYRPVLHQIDLFYPISFYLVNIYLKIENKQKCINFLWQILENSQNLSVKITKLSANYALNRVLPSYW